MKISQIIAVSFVIILVLNIILMIKGWITDLAFWMIIVISFSVSYAIKKLKTE